MIRQGYFSCSRFVFFVLLTFVSFSFSAIAETYEETTHTLQGASTFNELNLLAGVIEGGNGILSVTNGITVYSSVNQSQALSAIHQVDSLHVGGDLVIDAATLQVWVAEKITVAGNVILKNGARLEASNQQLNSLNIEVLGSISVDATSEISVTGAGFRANTQSGPDGVSSVRMGCHAGWAGFASDDCSYGRHEKATLPGSASSGSNGGGVLNIEASSLILDGALSADANIVGAVYNGGAGGSINISVNEFSGNGRLSANGSAGYATAFRAGGGGRISIAVSTADLFTGFFEAHGGSIGAVAGAGTVYIKNGNESHGRLIVNNGGRAAVQGSTRIRQIGRHTIISASSPELGVWEIQIEGTPWEPSDVALGWGLDGIDVDLDASEGSSPLYSIVSNTENVLTVNSDDDLSGVVGQELVGVHTFQSIQLSGGASVSFGEDKLKLNQIIHSSIKSAANLKISRDDTELRLSIIDTDEDGIPNVWEKQFGLNPFESNDAILDRNNDGITNLAEFYAVGYRLGGDDDNDGMLDEWEVRYGLNAEFADQYLDQDQDGLTNLDEFLAGTNPAWHDSDNDASPDSEELLLSSNPLIKDFDIGLSSSNGAAQCAFRDNKVTCWGASPLIVNPATIPAVTLPSQVNVASGACVLDGGDINCWGHNGNGFVTKSDQANQVLGTITDVGVGGFWGCALDASNAVFCWGGAVPNATPDVSDAISLSVGASHACIVREGLKVECWGGNTYGESSVPSDLGDVSHIATGNGSSCAVSDGRLRCWGQDSFGVISAAPQNLTNVTQIKLGSSHACAVSDAGPVCWGDNRYGQLDIPALNDIRQIAIGARYTCLLTSQEVQCAGDYPVIPDELKDRTKPFDVRELSAETISGSEVTLNWLSPAFNPDDVDTYEITVAGQATIDVPAGNVSLTLDSLSPGSVYDVTVVTRDAAGNKSEGVSTRFATAYDNPNNLAGVGRSHLVDLTWSRPTPYTGIASYRIYQSDTAFTNITGMEPVLEVNKNLTAKSVGGLNNNADYFFAITSVNLSGFETKDVDSIKITPQEDVTAPNIDQVTYGSQVINPLTSFTVVNDDQFCVAVSDLSTISRVEFSIDGEFAESDSTAYDGYCASFKAINREDKSYNLIIAAYDVFENVAPQSYTFALQLSPPPTPTLTQPSSGLVTNQQTITVVGRSLPSTEVQVTVNDNEGQWTVVNASGQFSLSAFLAQQGENVIKVRARNRSGVGTYSDPITATLDTSLPAKPIGLNVDIKTGGVVALNWATGTGGPVASFDVYRSNSEAFDIPSNGKVNATPVVSAAYNDLVVSSGAYFYKVVSVNEFGDRSEPSLSVRATVDVDDPYAEKIEYLSTGFYDSVNGVYGRGTLTINVTVNEPLLTTPFLSISPDGGVPISVLLSPSGESERMYQGTVVLDESVRSGTAYAVFSARDKAGNRGTNISDGGQINIDTAGPVITAISTNPINPIENDSASPSTVMVSFEVNEPLFNSSLPILRYALSSTATTPQEATNVVKAADGAWQASIVLSSEAGSPQAETLNLWFEGQDALGNLSASDNPISSIQVYQGELPPLAAPFNFRGEAVTDGNVELEWFEVEQASAYRLYRKADGEADYSLLQELSTITSFVDDTPVDGIYDYQLSSVRNENGELAESARTSPVRVITDSVAPPKPQDLTLELFPIGIQASWSPVSESDVTYQLYKADNGPILDVSGLSLEYEGLSEPLVVDTNASQAKPAYVVVAVDSNGNKSEPSDTAYLNVDLLPISSLVVRLVKGDLPTLSWSHSKPSIDSFDVFFGKEGQTVKLNDSVINVNQYTDQGYSNESRTYSVVAIDSNDARSLPRFIHLPKVSLDVVEGQQIKRNLINVINVRVNNLSDQAITQASIKLLSEPGDFTSSRVDIAANATLTVPVTVSGLETLPDLWQPSLELHSQPHAGESIEVATPISLDVRDGALALRFDTEGFIRGADGTARLTIENTGDQAIQLITATNTGNSDSPDVLFSLRDEDNNVLSTSGLRQALGEYTVNNRAGEAVLTLAAGERRQLNPITLSVPLNAPDSVFLQATISNMYANRGLPEQVIVKGPKTRQQINLTETPYRGEVVSITPENSFGHDPIKIIGRALERGTDRPLPNVDLLVIITVDGFEREFDVITDENGTFELIYTAQEGESGVYKVSVLHPVQTSRPNDNEFVVNRLTVMPNALNVRTSYNLAYDIPFNFQAGEGSELNNLRFAIEAAQQPTGQLPEGIDVVFPSIEALTSSGSIQKNIRIMANETAAPQGELVISVYSDESPNVIVASIELGYAFSEAKPTLAFIPSILELGTKVDSSATGSISLENRGLAPLKDVRVTLKTADGFPAFDWLKLTTQNSLGDIAVGDVAKADILLQPANAPTGVEYFVLEVSSANAPTYQVPIVTSIVESGEGGILIKVTDMYSGTLNDRGQVIQGLSDANVRLQNQSDPSIEFNLQADELGEAFVSDIPAGRYSAWVSAPNYQEVQQRIRVQPGFISSEQIFLDYELIKLEWSVNEITLQDRYQIVLRATFETDVPAAVLMLEPTNITLPTMEPGDVFYGELNITNYGLIRAYDIKFVPQQSDEFYQFEYLTSVIPESLEAKEQVVVPFKVTALRSLEQQDATGGGCGIYTRCAALDGKSKCPTGVSGCSTASCVSFSYGYSCQSDAVNRPPVRPTYGDGTGYEYVNEGESGDPLPTSPLPLGPGFPKCSADGGDCKGSQERGGGSK